MPLLPAASVYPHSLKITNKSKLRWKHCILYMKMKSRQKIEKFCFLTKRKTLMGFFYYMIFMRFLKIRLCICLPKSLQQLLAHFNQDSQTRLSFKHSKTFNSPAQLIKRSRHWLLLPLLMDTWTLGGYAISDALPKSLPQLLEPQAGFGLHLGRDA